MNLFLNQSRPEERNEGRQQNNNAQVRHEEVAVVLQTTSFFWVNKDGFVVAGNVFIPPRRSSFLSFFLSPLGEVG